MSDKKTIKETAISVLGFADRLALPQRILDFCGRLPIYEVQEVSVDAMNATLYSEQGKGKKSYKHFSNKLPCLSAAKDLLGPVQMYPVNF